MENLAGAASRGASQHVGTARRRRAQRERTTGRHVQWLLDMRQAVNSHHTAGQNAHMGKAQLEAQVADLQLQVEALAHTVSDLQAALQLAGRTVQTKDEGDSFITPIKMEPDIASAAEATIKTYKGAIQAKSN